MNPNDIERIAAAAMAAAPQPPLSQQVQQPNPQQPNSQQAVPQAAPNPNAPQPETNEGRAQKDGAPRSEDAQMRAEPIVFEIPGKDGKPGRKLTSTQIEGVLNRYTDLNYKHATLKPVIELAERLLASNPNMTPADLADAVVSMAQAQQHNPQMGNQARAQVAAQQGIPQPTNQPGPASFDDAALQAWERDNAAQLPPGYRQMMQQMMGLAQATQQQESLLRQLLAQTGGVADAARATTQNAQTQAINAQRQLIGNNLDRAQQALSLPTERAQDFMTWAGERGYTLEDFADGQLTYKVMRDFRNDLMSGEMDRLKGIQTKRQSYTGTATVSPGGGATPQSGQPTEFDSFVSRQMAKRA